MTNTLKPDWGKVTMVKVADILAGLTFAVDGMNEFDEDGCTEVGVDWLRVVKEKGCDGHFSDIVGTIMARGFRVPVVITTADACRSYVEVEGDILGLGNGHHRMAAAILLALDEIPVYWSLHDFMASHASDSESIDYGTDIEFDIDEFVW